MRTQQTSLQSQPRTDARLPAAKWRNFPLVPFRLWNMIFHKLCEMDFVPFTLHELLSHFLDLPEFAHSWKWIFKSWEMTVFSVDFCCPQKVSGSIQWLSTWERKNCSGGNVRTGHTAVYKKERDQMLRPGNGETPNINTSGKTTDDGNLVRTR